MGNKQKRNRGIILTIKGWQKFQDAKIEHELRNNKGYKFTLEELSDRSKLTTATLRKILTRDCKVDKSSVVTLFAVLDLELDSDDYTSPESLKRPDNNQPTLKKIDWGDRKGEIEEARNYIKKAGYTTLAGSLPEKTAYRCASDEGKAISEVSYLSLRKRADEMVQDIINRITEKT